MKIGQLNPMRIATGVLLLLAGAQAGAYTCADYFVAGTYGVDGAKDGALNAPGYSCNIGTNSVIMGHFLRQYADGEAEYHTQRGVVTGKDARIWGSEGREMAPGVGSTSASRSGCGTGNPAVPIS